MSREVKFQKKTLILLEKIKGILEEYEQQKIKVTLRQLYYQLVARGTVPNKENEYKKVSRILTEGRYNGFISWESIEDRSRIPRIPNIFKDIPELLEIAKKSYQKDRWQQQEFYVELWTEKDAISSVIRPVTDRWQVPVSVNRGYLSTSSVYDSAQRFLKQDKKNIILYLGDHDPSGLDMDRDIKNRLSEMGVEVEIIRIGLTIEQIRTYNPPENPAKIKDTRAKKYIGLYGTKSWEVDALDPEMLQGLIEDSILEFLDVERYNLIKEQEKTDLEVLK